MGINSREVSYKYCKTSYEKGDALATSKELQLQVENIEAWF